MKIYQVTAEHIFYQLGARSGDIIKRVNGMPLGETEKMLEIWSAIKVAQKSKSTSTEKVTFILIRF